MATESALNTAPALRLKASLHPFTVLELDTLDIESIRQDLLKRLEQAPQLLLRAPVVIQLPNQPVSLELGQQLVDMLKALELIPIGLRYSKPADGDNSADSSLLADALNLPFVKESNKDSTKESSKTPISQPPMVVKHPVRSGQQVVNPDGDLIIFGNVGQGAEVLAAGHIHVYGTLHGRALAGIKGNQDATITCLKLQSELFAIAGQFQVSEDMASQHWQQTAHICLRDGRLIIESD